MNTLVRNLMSPPAAQTDRSIAILWDKPGLEPWNYIGYRVYLDGALTGFCRETDYTFRNLDSGREYAIQVSAVTWEDEEQPLSPPIRVATKPASPRFNIESFGAVGDGRTLNTAAIQRAIDDCVPGGTVLVPPGVFVTGAIFLKSDMTLEVAEGGMLLGSADERDYPVFRHRFEGREQMTYASLVNTPQDPALMLHDIALTGKGVIDANGMALVDSELKALRGKRGGCVCLRNVENLYIEDVTMRQSPFWCFHIIYCRHVSVNRLNLNSKRDEFARRYNIVNGDGVNPDSTTDFYMFHSLIESGDDCVAIKAGWNEEGRAVNRPSSDLRITDCVFRSGFGVAVGSEMAAGIRNVLVRDCRFENTYSIASVKAPRGRGGVLENIRYENCRHFNNDLSHHDCRWFRGAICIDQFYSHETFDAETPEPINDGTATIRNVCFENISLDTRTGNAIYLAGLPEQPLENIEFHNVCAAGKSGFVAYNVDGLMLDRVSVLPDDGEPLRLTRVKMKP